VRTDDLEKDRTLAAHILKIHVQGTSTLREPSEADLDVPLLKRYVAYARKTCSPRLTQPAMLTLQNYYIQIRQGLVAEDAEIERRGRAPRAVRPSRLNALSSSRPLSPTPSLPHALSPSPCDHAPP
jgi:DNA replicative helicase MCM subunit Mcm2 (Cdc46/Mcm family)